MATDKNQLSEEQQKTASNYISNLLEKEATQTTAQDDLTQEDPHDRYQGFDTAKEVGARKLKYQLGGAALGAIAAPVALGGLAYLAKHKFNREVDPRATAQSAFTGGLGTGFMLGGMAAKAKQAERDRKVLEARYKDDPKSLAIAQDHGIAMAEALRDLKKKAEELGSLFEKKAAVIKLDPQAGNPNQELTAKKVIADQLQKEKESPAGQYA